MEWYCRRLKISDSVIPGWSVFGVRVSNKRGGYSGLIADNVYFEASPACKQHSPYGNVGSSAIIAEGAQVKISGLTANGASWCPIPTAGHQQGLSDRLYWVVPVSAQYGDGVPLPAGLCPPPMARRRSPERFRRLQGHPATRFSSATGTAEVFLSRIRRAPIPADDGSNKLRARRSPVHLPDNGGSLPSIGRCQRAPVRTYTCHAWISGLGNHPRTSPANADPNLMLQADVLKVGGIVTTQPAWPSRETTTIVGSPASPPAAANIEALHTNGLGPFPGATIMTASNLPQQSPIIRGGSILGIEVRPEDSLPSSLCVTATGERPGPRRGIALQPTPTILISDTKGASTPSTPGRRRHRARIYPANFRTAASRRRI